VQYDLARKTGRVIMLESIINLVSSGAVDSHTPQTAVAAVLCAAMIGLFS
ncbi:LOW QUALITY PROTEIN: hypothetical protein SSJG_04493, partial [Escherichia coli D9]